jgi:hypothetical protein
MVRGVSRVLAGKITQSTLTTEITKDTAAKDEPQRS